MSSTDDIIRERLQKLKTDDSKNLPSSSAQGNLLPKPNKSTAAEQVEDLLAQIVEETYLEGRVKRTQGDIDALIRSRLEKLKSREDCDFSNPRTSLENKSDGIHDEDFFNKSSCSELLELHSSTNSDISEDECYDSEESVCGICNKEPTLICFGCEKDLYCNNCYKQFHTSGEKHKTEPYSHKRSCFGTLL